MEQYVVVKMGTNYGYNGVVAYSFDTIKEVHGPFPTEVEAERWAKKKFRRHGNYVDYRVRKFSSV